MEKLNPNRLVVDSLQEHMDQSEEQRLIEEQHCSRMLNTIFGPEVVAEYLVREGNSGGANISLFSIFSDYSNQSKKYNKLKAD